MSCACVFYLLFLFHFYPNQVLLSVSDLLLESILAIIQLKELLRTLRNHYKTEFLITFLYAKPFQRFFSY